MKNISNCCFKKLNVINNSRPIITFKKTGTYFVLKCFVYIIIIINDFALFLKK